GRYLAGVRADHRHTARHRLHYHPSELLAPIGPRLRGEHEKIERVHEGWKAAIMYHPREVYSPSDAQRCRRCLQLVLERSASRQHQMDIFSPLRSIDKGPQQCPQAFLLDQFAGVAYNKHLLT